MTAEPSAEVKKEEAISILKSQLPGFRWAIEEGVLDRDALVKKAEEGSEEIIKLVLGRPGLTSPQNGVVLGKRYECLVCGQVVLCTKKGPGSLACCDQRMIIQESKVLPSSD